MIVTRRELIAGAGAATATSLLPLEALAESCYGLAANRDRGILAPVFRFAIPPLYDSQPGFPFWPGHGFMLFDIRRLRDSAFTGTKVGAIWADRWSTNPATVPGRKPNPVIPRLYRGAHECRAEFSSILRANTSTRCKMLYMLGANLKTVRNAAAAGGLDPSLVRTWQDAQANRQSIFTRAPSHRRWAGKYLCSMDQVILPEIPFPEIDEVILDYECMDGRTTSQTNSFLLDMTTRAQSYRKPISFWFNRLTSTAIRHSGLGPNLPYLQNLAGATGGAVTIIVFGGPDGANDWGQDFLNQYVKFGPQRSLEKVMLVFGLGDATIGMARSLREKIEKGYVPKRLCVWQHYAPPGDACARRYNAVLGCIAMGRHMP